MSGADWKAYTERIQASGTGRRERTLTKARERISVKGIRSLSYKKVLLDHQEQYLIIDSIESNPRQKRLRALPGETFFTGSYIRWADTIWLITETDSDTEVYTKGKMQECNWLLLWQDEKGIQKEYWCIDENLTLRSSGESSDKLFTTGLSRHLLTLPCIEDTLSLVPGKRFFIDKNKERPASFRITQNDTTSGNYGNGLCQITLIQCEENSLTDRPDLGLCDYITPSSAPADEAKETHSVIVGPSMIRSGGKPVTFKAVFYQNGTPFTESITALWQVENAFDAEYQAEGNELRLSIDHDTLIGETIKLHLLNPGFQSEHFVTIASIYEREV